MNKIPKSSHKKGGAKKEYTGTYRHFTLHEVDGYDRNDIGTATIKDHQNPLDAAKKLLSSWYRHQGIKSNERNKHDIKFTIRETTRGHSKIYGPYKGKFVKYDKPLMIKLKSGKVIKRIGKPMIKLAKGNNKKMFGGNGKSEKIPINDRDLRELVNFIKGIPKLLVGKTTTINGNKITEFNRKEYVYNKAIEKGIKEEYIKNDIYNLSNLDVSGVKDMANLFEKFNFNIPIKIDITKWNVNNVTNMESMFADSKGFNQDLNGWNVYGVTNMRNMFLNCTDLNQSFSNWLIKENAFTDGMFSGCDKYKTRVGFSKILIKRTKGSTESHSPDIKSNSYWTSQKPYVNEIDT